MKCWPIILHVVHHIHHHVTRHIGHRIVRHTVIVPKLVKVIVCAGGIAVAPAIPSDHDKGAVIQMFLPPQFIYPPEHPRVEVRLIPPAIPVVQPIPEANTLWLLAGGTGLLLSLRRKPNEPRPVPQPLD